MKIKTSSEWLDSSRRLSSDFITADLYEDFLQFMSGLYFDGKLHFESTCFNAQSLKSYRCPN